MKLCKLGIDPINLDIICKVHNSPDCEIVPYEGYEHYKSRRRLHYIGKEEGCPEDYVEATREFNPECYWTCLYLKHIKLRTNIFKK